MKCDAWIPGHLFRDPQHHLRILTMRAHYSDFWPCTCSIERKTSTGGMSSSGDESLSTWACRGHTAKDAFLFGIPTPPSSFLLSSLLYHPPLVLNHICPSITPSFSYSHPPFISIISESHSVSLFPRLQQPPIYRVVLGSLTAVSEVSLLSWLWMLVIINTNINPRYCHSLWTPSLAVVNWAFGLQSFLSATIAFCLLTRLSPIPVPLHWQVRCHNHDHQH